MYTTQKKEEPITQMAAHGLWKRGSWPQLQESPNFMELKREVVKHVLSSKIMLYLGINYYLGLKESLLLSSICPFHFTFSSPRLKYSFLAYCIQSLLLHVSDLKLILQQRECFSEGKSNEKNIVKLEDIQRKCCD